MTLRLLKIFLKFFSGSLPSKVVLRHSAWPYQMFTSLGKKLTVNSVLCSQMGFDDHCGRKRKISSFQAKLCLPRFLPNSSSDFGRLKWIPNRPDPSCPSRHCNWFVTILVLVELLCRVMGDWKNLAFTTEWVIPHSSFSWAWSTLK